MSFGQIVFLGILQGLTEFLPISSSGHLVLTQKAMGLKEAPLAWDVFLHLGTLLAVLIFLRKAIWQLTLGVFQKSGVVERKTLVALLIATLPAAGLGFLFKNQIFNFFSSEKMVGVGFLITSFLLLSTKWSRPGKVIIDQLSLKQTLLIGLAQALALMPGISRSGATIVLGLWVGLTPHKAFTFSFLLSIPAILGANLLEIKDLSSLPSFNLALIGSLVAAIFGFLALKILKKVLLSEKLYLLAFYTLTLALLSFLL